MKRLISSAIVLSFIAVTASAGFAQTRPAPTKPSSKVERAPKYVKASDRSPSASPRSTDPARTDMKRDADGKPVGEKKY